MNNIYKLHTAVRRYCGERAFFWRVEYGKLCHQNRNRKEDGYDYTDEAYDIFPRYNVLDAILVEVEKYVPEEFTSLGQAKNQLITAALGAESLLTKPSNGDIVGRIILDELKRGTFEELSLADRMPKLFDLAELKAKDYPEPKNNEIEDRAMNEERQLLCKYINEMTEDELANIEPLFYRRVISGSESDRLWSELEAKWGINGSYWYPLKECHKNDVIALRDDFFDDELDIETLRNILKKHGVNRIWQLRELDCSPEYEIDTAAFSPSYTIDGEGYWCSNDMDWVIYASHENSITIAGKWLIDEVRLAWTTWEKKIWQVNY